MNPSNARFRETGEWLNKASEDLASARVLLNAGHPSTALFHCQQCAEKSLKAFLTWHDQPFRKTHNLEEVGLACIAIDPTLADIAQNAGVLTAYAWRLRYPGAPYTPDAEEADSMWNLARQTLGAIAQRLPVIEQP